MTRGTAGRHEWNVRCMGLREMARAEIHTRPWRQQARDGGAAYLHGFL